YLISYLDKNDKIIIIDTDTPKEQIIGQLKDKFELFIHTYTAYSRELINQKKMKIEPNDLVDLTNLLYIKKGQYYWTKEKRWINLIKEANMEKYIYTEQ
ncbi:MAG: hypothetical protein ACEPOW_07960, partial [Bacteroidales bacterium]